MMGNAATVKMSNSVDRQVVVSFRKSMFTDWDWNFMGILFICIFIEAVVVYILAGRPVPEYSEKEIAKIQERFASFVLKTEVRGGRETTISTAVAGGGTASDEEIVDEEIGGGGTGEEGGGTGTGEDSGSGTGEGSGGGGTGGIGEARRVSRVEAAEARRRTREEISRMVSNRGILGLLTGTGSATEGKAVSSAFNESIGGSGTGEDLDQILSSVDGLRTQGIPGSGGSGGGGGGEGGSGGGGGLRGERSGRKATIDDLVSDRSSVQSQTLTRKGELRVEAPTEVTGVGRKSIYRSPDAIQEVLISHNAAIRYCYERELKRNPTLKGKIMVRITIGADGAVKDAAIVNSSLNSERVERCILARIRLWKDFKPIDEAEGDVTFRQVYTFGY